MERKYNVIVRSEDNRVVSCNKAGLPEEGIDNGSEAVDLPEGYIVLHAENLPQVRTVEYCDPVFYYDGTVFETRYAVNRDRCRAAISALKAQLARTDHIVVKSAEFFMVGKDAGYDMEALHASRQQCRERIGDIESLLREE